MKLDDPESEEMYAPKIDFMRILKIPESFGSSYEPDSFATPVSPIDLRQRVEKYLGLRGFTPDTGNFFRTADQITLTNFVQAFDELDYRGIDFQTYRTFQLLKQWEPHPLLSLMVAETIHFSELFRRPHQVNKGLRCYRTWEESHPGEVGVFLRFLEHYTDADDPKRAYDYLRSKDEIYQPLIESPELFDAAYSLRIILLYQLRKLHPRLGIRPEAQDYISGLIGDMKELENQSLP